MEGKQNTTYSSYYVLAAEKSLRVSRTYVYVLVTDVCGVLRIRPIRVHVFYGFVHANRIQCVVVAKHQLFHLLIVELFVDFVIRSQTLVLSCNERTKIEAFANGEGLVRLQMK